MREVTQFSKKIVVRVNLRENSEVFDSEFSVLGMEQNGKLRVENLGKLILRVFRELRVFNLAELGWRTDEASKFNLTPNMTLFPVFFCLLNFGNFLP